MAYIDANCMIYLIEQNPSWFPKVAVRIQGLRSMGYRLAVGELVRAECFVGPFRSGDVVLEAQYRAIFTDPEFHMLTLTAAVFDLGARLRAKYSFKLPDALHLATAIEHGCKLFLTADAKLSRCIELPVELLS